MLKRVISRIFILFIFFSALFAVTPLQADSPAQRINYTTINKLQHVNIDDVAKYYKMTVTKSGTNVTLTRGKAKLIFTQDRREAKINGTSVILAYALLKKDNKYYISRSDFQNTVDPLIRVGGVKYHKVDHILIDPGHGGKDNGAQRDKYVEKDLALKIAKLLRTKLQKEGYKVSMTRTGDSTLSLNDRVAAAHRLKVDLVISIHMNTAGDSTVSGIETFSIPSYNTPPSNSNKAMTKKSSGHANDKNSLALAYAVQRALTAKTKAADRSVKRMNFLVLRDIKVPTILIECGFISNKTEAWRLNTADYQDKITDSIVNGVKSYKSRLRQPKKK